MPDVLIIGGGVIGLSLAWDLAQHGQSVQVIDRGEPGKEASWAGAGILPPASWKVALHPYDQLRALSSELHPPWAASLSLQTGIDTGYRQCGGIYLARTPGEAASLVAWASAAADEGIVVRRLEDFELEEFGVKTWGRLPACPESGDPGTGDSKQILAAYFLPQEAQLRNPRHLQAFRTACKQSGVEITPGVEALDFEIHAGRLAAVITSAGPLQAGQFCFTSGAWTGNLCTRLGIPLGILPIRGQMVLFNTGDSSALKPIVTEGSRYLVPRDDGRILAGSTEEEVGFDKSTTEEAIADLASFARGLIPALENAPIERTWAGLRPASFDGFPYLGPLPGLSNCFIASGHFRSGLYLSPATAVVMSQLLRGEQPRIDLGPFRVLR
ncbi:MAG: FAD-dependent oxidoreductase [Pirellulaceae bacterium]|nr:FAD-dependent oxidoreductase [Pirellulaceae bacterium]